MFLYMKTNILRGLGIFKIDFPVVTNQLLCYPNVTYSDPKVTHSEPTHLL